MIVFFEDTKAGTLRDNFGIVCINLRNRSNTYFEGICAVNLGRTLVSCTCGRTYRHIALDDLLFSGALSNCGEQIRGVGTVKFLSSYKTVPIPATESLNEIPVGLVVKQEVVASWGSVGRAELFTHVDKPVGFRVVSERNRIGIDFFNLSANCFQFVPSGRDTQSVLIKEGFVVVQNFGGLGERHSVGKTIFKNISIVEKAFYKVGFLLFGQSDNFSATVGSSNYRLVINKIVQRPCRA